MRCNRMSPRTPNARLTCPFLVGAASGLKKNLPLKIVIVVRSGAPGRLAELGIVCA